MNFDNTRVFAEDLDRRDSLAAMRDKFYIPRGLDGLEQLYFCGNSLGLQPKSTREYLDEILDSWANNAVEGHFSGKHPWLQYHEFATEKLGHLVGANPLEVVAMNSLTVNLHLMMVSFYRPTANRYKVLIEKDVFPSDRYAVLSQINFHGQDPADALIEVGPREGEDTIRNDDLLELIDREGEGIALIMLPGVQYYTGQAFDLAEITRAAHRMGCKVGFDLAHAVGNLSLQLHQSGTDFAVWCSYKYLNAGPGALAGCFVHERHGEQTELPRFAGWWGHDKASRFQMPDRFSALPGAEGWQISNPQILSMAPLLASLDLFEQAGMAALRAKSERLTSYLEFLLSKECGDRISIITPAIVDQRGAQLSITVKAIGEKGKRVHEKLGQAGMVCDWREPDVIRVAPVPLYNRFMDVFEFVSTLRTLF